MSRSGTTFSSHVDGSAAAVYGVSCMPLCMTVADALEVMLALELSLPMAMLPLLVIAMVIVVGKTTIVFCCCCSMLLLVSTMFTGVEDPDCIASVSLPAG